MDIENVTITKKATHKSKEAIYQLEYSINNGILSWIRATVNKIETDDYGNHVYIGSIHYENNMINCSLPAQSNVAAYFEDFKFIITSIEEDVRLYSENLV